MIKETAVTQFVNEYSRVSDKLLGEHDPALAALRNQALNQFTTLGFPSNKNENWKYTKLTGLERKNFIFTAEEYSKNIAIAPYSIHADCHLLVFVAGKFAAHLSHISNDAIVITHLQQALATQPELVKHYLTNSVPAADAFSALNNAFLSDGAFIQVAKGQKVTKPIHLLFIQSAAETQQEAIAFYNFKNLIIAEENAQLEIIEHYVTEHTDAYFCNSQTIICAEAHSQVQHCKIINESAQAYHIDCSYLLQKTGSEIKTQTFAFNGLLVRSDTKVSLQQEHARCDLAGLFAANGKQHMDFHTFIDHAKPHGTSRQFYKGILHEQARGVFNGKVLVQTHAQKTDAQQQNKNLLLSTAAEMDTKPELEIYADDVKCSHGATVGQIDEEALFYLRARGIAETDAKAMLIYAFAEEIIASVTNSELKTYLTAQLHLKNN